MALCTSSIDHDSHSPPESCAKPIQEILDTWQSVPPDLELQSFRERTIKHLQDTKVPFDGGTYDDDQCGGT